VGKEDLMAAAALKALILDWAGTTVDHGSRAPTGVFIELFRGRGISITSDEARGPMGMAKLEHIAAIARLPRVAQLWRLRHGAAPTDADVWAMYQEFVPMQKERLALGSDVIAGVPEAIAACRARGLKIGSTTGYTRELMNVVAPSAARGGYVPDVIVCADEVRAGRPAPWLNFRTAELLDVYPMSAVVIVDDTPVGIEAGLNAGAWTVAVTQTGNALGLSAAEVAELPAPALDARLASIERAFLSQGAHLAIRSVSELPGALSRLDHQRP
jgi:phosphonoacetaldehyde hydrolase